MIDNYLYSIYDMLRRVHSVGGFNNIHRPYLINKKDRIILNNIYSVYKIYKYNFTKREFRRMASDLSLMNGKNVVSNGLQMAETIEKTIKL